MRVGQAPQNERIHHGKNRGVCADGKRQRKDHRHGETWIAPQLARCKLEVSTYSIHPRSSLRAICRTLDVPEEFRFVRGIATCPGLMRCGSAARRVNA